MIYELDDEERDRLYDAMEYASEDEQEDEEDSEDQFPPRGF